MPRKEKPPAQVTRAASLLRENHDSESGATIARWRHTKSASRITEGGLMIGVCLGYVGGILAALLSEESDDGVRPDLNPELALGRGDQLDL